jgi:TATA-box binding protein (TBP) (component of TFIID and TFIIIB)
MVGQGTVPPSVNNIKVRVKVEESALSRLRLALLELEKNTGHTPKKKKIFQRYHNFIVYRSSYTFTVFFDKGAANITGIPNFLSAPHAIQSFCEQFNVSKSELSTPIVDNVTASGTFDKFINLRELKRVINCPENEGSLISSASFNVNYFPACFCKTQSIGTVAVFGSGKFNIVGAKCQDHVDKLFQAIYVYISRQ